MRNWIGLFKSARYLAGWVLVVAVIVVVDIVVERSRRKLEAQMSQETGDLMLVFEPTDDGGYMVMFRSSHGGLEEKWGRMRALTREMAACVPIIDHGQVIKLTRRHVVCMGEVLQRQCPCSVQPGRGSL